MHESELIGLVPRNAGDSAMVVVVEAKGSAPRHPGSRMLVLSDGRNLGSVGGGPVEEEAIRKARECIAAGRSGGLTAGLTGDKALGSEPICGGAVSLAILFLADAAPYAAASKMLERGEPVVLVTPLEKNATGCRAVAQADGSPVYGASESIDASAVRAALDANAPVVSSRDGFLYDPVRPRDRLLILGGGHVGLSLARLAAELDFEVCVGDSRPEYAAADRFPEGIRTASGKYEAIIADYPFGPSTYAVVATPSHTSDLDCVRAILKREYRYAGFLGSARKTRMILEQVVREGLPEDKARALRAPIGADIGAETPAEIAVSILAEIVAVRRGSPAAAEMDRDRERRRT